MKTILPGHLLLYNLPAPFTAVPGVNEPAGRYYGKPAVRGTYAGHPVISSPLMLNVDKGRRSNYTSIVPRGFNMRSGVKRYG